MIKQRNWLKTISLILLFAILVYLIWNLQTLIVYVLISGIISIIANPLVDYCDKIKYKKIIIPRGLSAIL
jgi:predicted PurR-regulated permease PerM